MKAQDVVNVTEKIFISEWDKVGRIQFFGKQNISMDSCPVVDFLLIRSLFAKMKQFVKNEKSRLDSFGKFF